MRALRIALGCAVALVLGLPLLHLAIVEGAGEVVVLTTFDDDGAAHETHLWVVEHEGHRYVNAGSADAAWLARIGRHPEVEVREGGRSERMHAVAAPEERAAILALMRTRYGWADRYVRTMVGREAVPVRLAPLRDGA